MTLLICKWEHKVEVQVCIVSWASALQSSQSFLTTFNSSFTNRTLCWNHTQLLQVLCRRYFLFHNTVFSKACFLCLKSILSPQACLQSLIVLQVSLGHRLHEGFLLLLLSRGPDSFCALLTFQLQDFSHCMQTTCLQVFLIHKPNSFQTPKDLSISEGKEEDSWWGKGRKYYNFCLCCLLPPVYIVYVLFVEVYIILCMRAKTLHSCPTLSDHMDCSPPGSSVHGVSQARIHEWLAILSTRRSSWLKGWTHIS